MATPQDQSAVNTSYLLNLIESGRLPFKRVYASADPEWILQDMLDGLKYATGRSDTAPSATEDYASSGPMDDIVRLTTTPKEIAQKLASSITPDRLSALIRQAGGTGPTKRPAPSESHVKTSDPKIDMPPVDSLAKEPIGKTPAPADTADKEGDAAMVRADRQMQEAATSHIKPPPKGKGALDWRLDENYGRPKTDGTQRGNASLSNEVDTEGIGETETLEQAKARYQDEVAQKYAEHYPETLPSPGPEDKPPKTTPPESPKPSELAEEISLKADGTYGPGKFNQELTPAERLTLSQKSAVDRAYGAKPSDGIPDYVPAQIRALWGRLDDWQKDQVIREYNPKTVAFRKKLAAVRGGGALE